MISICMIGKNEENIIEKSLTSLKQLGYEIIFVDTGSTDKTKQIASKYTENVYDYVWCDDFSDARNFSISKASNDYVLIIDCDEVVNSYDLNKMEQLIQENPYSVGKITIINSYTRQNTKFENKVMVNRLFSRNYYYFTGKIHEQITKRPDTAINTTETYTLPLSMYHFGYEGSPEVLKNKADRNIKLLQKELELSPNDTYILYQLGKSYYMKSDYDSCYKYLDKALYFDVDPSLEYVQDLIQTYGYALINTGNSEKALQLEGIYEEFSNVADFKFLMGLIYMNNSMFERAIDEFKKATSTKKYNVVGVNSFLSNYNIGVIYECTGKLKNAIEFYKKCGNYEPALNRLKFIY